MKSSRMIASATDLAPRQGEPPRVAAVHDLSCYGRCALTAVLPTLSVCGCQAIPLPTALLSTQTGEFANFSFLDLTNEMQRILAHWQALELPFSAVYSGFLGSAAQADTVLHLPELLSGKPLLFVDPVLGENGALYPTVTTEQVEAMRRLAARADVLTPNLTEAAFLLSDPSVLRPSVRDLPRILHALAPNGGKRVVLTGIPLEDDQLGDASLDLDGTYELYTQPRIPAHYPGTGDLFGSVLLGKLLHGKSLGDSVAIAAAFVGRAIAHTHAAGVPAPQGVWLEPLLWKLANHS